MVERCAGLGLGRTVHAGEVFSDTSSEAEHALARALPGMTDELMERAIQNGHAAAFAR